MFLFISFYVVAIFVVACKEVKPKVYTVKLFITSKGNHTARTAAKNNKKKSWRKKKSIKSLLFKPTREQKMRGDRHLNLEELTAKTKQKIDFYSANGV